MVQLKEVEMVGICSLIKETTDACTVLFRIPKGKRTIIQ
jgi:hypothetical protein